MAEDTTESTRVMPAVGAQDSTMVAQPPIGAGATQMGSTLACAVCGSQNPALETYCVECGFLLSSAPGAAADAGETPQEGPELVEAGSGRRFRLAAGLNVVGREAGDVLLMDGKVSRRHAQIEVQNGAVVLTDFGSTNGTFVDGQRLTPSTPTPVQPGATLRFGSATLSLVLPGEEPAAAPTIMSDVSDIVPAATSADAVVEPQPEPAKRAGEPVIARLQPRVADGLVICIYEGTNTIGRRASNDTVISGDPYVSGRHVEITSDPTGCYITDVGSTNGTLVNGSKLMPDEKQLLLDGDEVAIGQGTYLFESTGIEPGEPAAQEPDELAAEAKDETPE